MHFASIKNMLADSGRLLRDAGRLRLDLWPTVNSSPTLARLRCIFAVTLGRLGADRGPCMDGDSTVTYCDFRSFWILKDSSQPGVVK